MNMRARKTVVMEPKQNEGGRYVFGISMNANYREKVGSWETIKYSAYEVKYWISATLEPENAFPGQGGDQ